MEKLSTPQPEEFKPVLNEELLIALSCFNEGAYNKPEYQTLNEHEKAVLDQIIVTKKDKHLRKKGLKPFIYYGNNGSGTMEEKIVWAINKKNADRKAKKNGWH